MKRRFLLALVLVAFAGCQKKDTDTPATPPPAQGDEEAGFSVALKYYAADGEDDTTFAYRKSYMRQLLHKGASTFDETCKAEVGEDIECILESDEEDLYHYGAGFEFNVPPDMCEYIYQVPYLYYGLSAGNGVGTITVDTVGAQTGSDANSDGDLADAGELTDPTVCQYDHGPDYPNCCGGTYTRINRTWNGASYDLESVTTGNAWGGKTSNCIDGPAQKLGDWPKDKNGTARVRALWTYGVGSKLTYQIYAPISSASGGPRGNNIFAASWYDPADHGATTPTAMISGDSIACMDRDGELIARIRLSVREWNTKIAFEAMTDSPDDHSLTGAEDSPFGTFPLNDWNDWKDVGSGFPGLP